MENIITIKNLGKKYNITHQRGGYVALRDVLTNIFKNPFKFAKHKAKQIAGLETKEEFWALKDINFEVAQGEVIGIIGANGAGKSTLLKILTGITPPTEGEIIMRGKVASLLEVGTGFHPELTGRENIFLNGAILGMTKKEIARKFDEIVTFSGIEKFLDTPVKYYSSGMYVRLAFSVAAHMEPDILLVDEVLAVGDAEFQKKCLGKMEEVTRELGRTILFVSHNMGAIQMLCQKTILLEQGKVKMIGETNEVINAYLTNTQMTKEGADIKNRTDRKGKGEIKITTFFIENKNGEKVNQLTNGEYYTFCFKYESTTEAKTLENLTLTMAISLENGTPLALVSSNFTKQNFNQAPPQGVVRCRINQKLPLTEGIYNIAADLFSAGQRQDFIKNLGVIEVKSGDFYGTGQNLKHSPIYLEQDWGLEQTD